MMQISSMEDAMAEIDRQLAICKAHKLLIIDIWAALGQTGDPMPFKIPGIISNMMHSDK